MDRNRPPWRTGAAVLVIVGAMIAVVLSDSDARASLGYQLLGPTPRPPLLQDLPLPPPGGTRSPSGSSPAPTRVIAEVPERSALAPSTTLRTYTDPSFQFSFQYPANWLVEASPAVVSELPVQGYGLTIRNYDPPNQLKRDFLPTEIKIKIALQPLPAEYSSSAAWVADRQRLAPGLQIPAVQTVVLDSMVGQRWIATGPQAPQGVVTVAAARDSRLYVIAAVPASTLHIAAFDDLVRTFRLPNV